MAENPSISKGMYCFWFWFFINSNFEIRLHASTPPLCWPHDVVKVTIPFHTPAHVLVKHHRVKVYKLQRRKWRKFIKCNTVNFHPNQQTSLRWWNVSFFFLTSFVFILAIICERWKMKSLIFTNWMRLALLVSSSPSCYFGRPHTHSHAYKQSIGT